MAEIPSTEGSGNVFENLDVPDLKLHLAKAHLVARIALTIGELGLSQASAGLLMNIDQPKVSALLRGHFRGYSVDRLMTILNKLGHDVRIVISRERHAPGEASTLEVVTD